MSEAYFGEIRLLPYVNDRVPVDWMACNGQILSINNYVALFSLLGTTYGGDGRTTFALPDLRGRIPIDQGAGPGLAPHPMGEFAGSETVTLLERQMAPHTHPLQASSDPAIQSNPVNNVLAAFATPFYATATGGTAVGIPITTNTPAGQPHNNMAPTIALQYCICINGIFPSRA